MAFFDQTPIWLLYLLTVGFALLAGELGFRLSQWIYQRRPDAKKDTALDALIASLLGLLAFLLAFTTGFGLSHYDRRQQLVVSEANAIGTSYLRAGYLNDDDLTEARELLREYTDVRLSAVDAMNWESALARSEEIQARLWAIAEQNGREYPDSIAVGLFGEAINQLIDIHTSRLIALIVDRIPVLMWIMLYTVAFLAFLMVGVVSSVDGKRNYFALVLFALGFAAVLTLLLDMDRSQQGLIRVSQRALIELQRQIGSISP
ncbi:MAG TPA: hypothetical protein DEH25_10950 [Chloroflexi bacterium]|nr:hypothetical protein [Chloroflexota bacterium]